MVGVGMISPSQGKNHAGFAQFRHLPMPSESRHGGHVGSFSPVKWIRSRLFGGIGPKAAAGRSGAPPNPNCGGRSIYGRPGNCVIRALPAVPSPPELAEKIPATT